MAGELAWRLNFHFRCELGVPFERPDQFGTREQLTDKEFAEREAQARRTAEADAEEFVSNTGRGAGGGGGVGPPNHWLDRGRPSHRSSIVIEPADGKIPYRDAAARQRAASAVNARTSGNKPYDGPDAHGRGHGHGPDLAARVAALETAVEENRRLNQRLADVVDVVTELLVPALDRDDAKVAAALANLNKTLNEPDTSAD